MDYLLSDKNIFVFIPKQQIYQNYLSIIINILTNSYENVF